MALLTRQAILEAIDLPQETVEVPEWGGAVIVRGLTGAERDAFEAVFVGPDGQTKRDGLANFRARLVALSCVDEVGERLFGDGDMAALGCKSALALQRVFNAARRLSGLSRGDVEELTKNSDDGQSGDSTSD